MKLGAGPERRRHAGLVICVHDLLGLLCADRRPLCDVFERGRRELQVVLDEPEEVARDRTQENDGGEEQKKQENAHQVRVHERTVAEEPGKS